jgi:translation elongation factor EF-Tu-like GTPase
MIMIKIKAKIRLYINGRITPFANGYRPLFNFIDEMKTSGMIHLINKNEFCPGEEGVVEISFLDNQYLGTNFGKGTGFTFGEGREPLGEGEILEIIN